MGRMTDTPPPTPPTPPYQAPAAAQPLSPSDERLWATLIHIGGILFGFLSPLIGWLVLKDRSAFVGEHSKSALNFQLTMLIALIVGYITTLIFIGILIIIAAYIVILIFEIMGALAANKGQHYKYPFAIKFIK